MKRQLKIFILIISILFNSASLGTLIYANNTIIPEGEDVDFFDFYDFYSYYYQPTYAQEVIMMVNSPLCTVSNYGWTSLIDPDNDEIKPILVNNSVLVPLRFISEKFGASVEWIEETKTSNISTRDTDIYITIDSKTMYVNGNSVELETSAQKINGRTYVPVRALCEALGKKVYYKENIIVISEEALVFDATNGEEERFIKKYLRELKYIPQDDYLSEEEAKKDMKQVQIKTWTLNSNGTKSPSTKTILVNKEVAEDVVKIFEKIFNGEEKFPIKDVGGFAWRGAGSTSSHMWGLAIDINSNENYFVDFGDEEGEKIMAGSHWKPNEDPYSIPSNGDVVKAFEEYGWFWGGNGWGTTHDYMHFSWTGR